MKIFEITFFGITFAPTYYALMYILGFLAAWFFVKKFFTFQKNEDLDDLFFLIGLGVIFGGRLGYVLLYNFSYYLASPAKIFAIWEGGMSFHGGLFGVIIAVYYFSRQRSYHFWKILDILAVIAPIGLLFGRFGNYLNNELYGFANYSGPFAMIVDGIPHFPSPLLEMLLEGFFLFLILSWVFFRTNFRLYPGKISGIFLVWYAIFRIFAEFFRLPDANIWYLFSTNSITAWMLYSAIMLIFGWFLLMKKQKTEE